MRKLLACGELFDLCRAGPLQCVRANFHCKGETMNRVLSSAVVVAGLVLTLGGATSWGQVPPTNDKSDANFNTGGGTGALESTMLSGTNNTAYGHAALVVITSGSSNTAVGDAALYNITSGSSNTAVGASALQDNGTGKFNTAVGFEALLFNASDNNTAVGYAALRVNTS